MKHTYRITGMTCSSCEAKVKTALFKLPEVTDLELDRENQSITIGMSEHIGLDQLQKQLPEKYSIESLESLEPIEDENKSWWKTYRPINTILFYLLVVCVLAQYPLNEWNWGLFMRHFMAGFFLTFSFFKWINIRGFVDSYQMYDVLAKQWRNWAYVYAAFEFFAGIAFLTGIYPQITYLVTLVVMGISIIGVLRAVFSKTHIQCACLGDVFKLPMSTVTIIEDGLMILMSAYMLYTTL